VSGVWARVRSRPLPPLVVFVERFRLGALAGRDRAAFVPPDRFGAAAFRAAALRVAEPVERRPAALRAVEAAFREAEAGLREPDAFLRLELFRAAERFAPLAGLAFCARAGVRFFAADFRLVGRAAVAVFFLAGPRAWVRVLPLACVRFVFAMCASGGWGFGFDRWL
jgi:hypothetical protein